MAKLFLQSVPEVQQQLYKYHHGLQKIMIIEFLQITTLYCTYIALLNDTPELMFFIFKIP